MRLIEAEKVKRAMKDYWKAQVDKALIFTDGNEANKRINSYLEHNHDLLKAIDELPSAEPDITTHDSIPAETGENDEDRTSGDCISRQAVTKFLNDWLSCLFENCHKQSASDLKMIIKDFKNLPSAQPEQRWIPCSERQPDKGDDYLVTLWDDGRTWVEIALWNETFGGRWQAVLYNDVDYSDISNVIAWMPLPEIYQEGGEADE